MALDPAMADHLDAIRQRGLVILAGAGISMLPPSALPGWRDFNQAVLDAISARVARDTNKPFVEERLKTLTSRRESERAYAPDFMAQLMEEEIGADYFRVLQALDADAVNQNHVAIAALARAGHLRAIVTTNFDRLLERALAAAGVEHRVFASATDFDHLAEALSAAGGPLPLIKAHGTVDRVDTMVDTLAQRVAGRPETLNTAVRTLLERHVCLTLGFSGEDLDYDPDYLGLRSAAGTAQALRVLVRTGTTPLAAMQRLVAAYGERGRALDGALPALLLELTEALDATVPAIASTTTPIDWKSRLVAHATAWVDSLGTMAALTMFISLVDANGDDPWMIDFLLYFRRYYRTEEHTVDPWLGTPTYWRYEYQFGRRLLERGRLTNEQHERDNGQRLLSSTVIHFEPHENALNMLAGAWKRGQRLDARVAMCEVAFWVYGPGRAVVFASQTWQQVAEGNDHRSDDDAMIAISRVFEWSGEYELALAASSAGITDSGRRGDEPRRAHCLVQHARALACVKRYDESDAALVDAATIVGRLKLHTLGRDVEAARGMLDVMRSRDRDAIEPLTLACAHYRRTGRLPRLFIALLDLARAGYYGGDTETLQHSQRELYALCDLFPNAEGLVTLLTSELAQDQQDWPLLEKCTTALERFATRDEQYPWKWLLTRAERHRARLKDAGLSTE